MTQANKGGGATQGAPSGGARPKTRPKTKPNGEMPGWTNGLRQLYDRVVDEDLPDSFRDLIARLDDNR